MTDKFTNLQTDGEITGQNPDAREDYFKIEDYMRDHDYWQNRIAQAIKALSAHPATDVQILYGGHVHDGGSGTVDIEEGMALGYDIDGEVRIIKLPEQTGVSLPSGWNDNRQIWVASKYDYKLTSDTRQHYNAETYHHILQDTHHADANAYGNGSGPPSDDYFLDSSPASTYVVWGSFQMNGTTFTDASVGERSLEWSGVGSMAPDLVNNLGLSYSSNILKLVQANGSDLGAGGFGLVVIPSVTDGQLKRLRVYKNTHLFEDDGGTSDIVGEEFGVTTGVAWGEDRPFYLYAVNADDTDQGVEFAISPNPTAKQSPATANCGYHGNPAATPSDSNFFFLTSTNVTTTHNEKPCTLIGGVRMQMSASDDWTVQALDSSAGDGIRKDPFVGQWFGFPRGQMGADSNNYFSTVGTSPTWATPASMVYKYKINLDGEVTFMCNTRPAGNATNGSGGQTLNVHVPYGIDTQTVTELDFFCGVADVTGTGYGLCHMRAASDGTTTAGLFKYQASNIGNDSFGSVSTDLKLFASYYAKF